VSTPERLALVRDQMARACAAAGRRQQDVTLVAVSKGQPAAAIREAYAAGQRDFGENYAQELRDKAEDLKDLEELRWHFLGPVQTNKVKYLAGRIVLLHSLDRAELAEALAARLQSPLDVLLEVNVGAEPQKHGVLPGDVPALVGKLVSWPHIRLRGLMCIPPADDAEAARPHFAALRTLSQSLGLAQPVLSMGMSADFPVAIQEGATIIRVGTAIFGARPPRTGAG